MFWPPQLRLNGEGDGGRKKTRSGDNRRNSGRASSQDHRGSARRPSESTDRVPSRVSGAVGRKNYEKDRRNLLKHSGRPTMATSLEETLISVWKQVLVEEVKGVTLQDRCFPVRRTSRSRLREVDFQFEGHELRGLEQNPETPSRWAQLARQGKKVMQFLQERRYIAVVVEGKVQFYGKPMLSDERRR